MSCVGVPSGKDPSDTSGDHTSEGTDNSWGADEFKSRRNAFENRKEVEMCEDDGARTTRGLKELMLPKAPEFGLSFNRPSSSDTYSADKDGSMEAVRSPPSQSSSGPWTHHVPHPLSGAPVMEGPAHIQAAMTQQRFIDEDDDGLGVSSSRRPHPQNSDQPDILSSINSGGGGGGGTNVVGRPSPSYHHHLDTVEESEREDPGLSQQVEFLTAKNCQLLKQLDEREIERDRLREQLETQRVDKGLRFVCSPTGLPSRVLDGRKVLTSPGISSASTPSSPHPHSQSPLPPASPLCVLSPVPPLHQHPHHHYHHPRTTSPLSPHSRYPTQSAKDASGEISGSSSSDYQPRRETPSSPMSSVTKQYFQQIEELKQASLEMEKRLRELSDEKRRLESELSQKKESFLKMQAREQDLSKDIELLRDENSHHTIAIKRLQSERDGLKSENESLHDELTSLNDKLNKTEKCYKEVEHENLSLEAEIEQLVADKKLLCDEKQKLQVAVEGALKTKESFRSTIKQLRMDNLTLEDSMRRQPADNGRGGSGGAGGRQKKTSEPATPAQKTLNEVMDLREEKWALQGKLLSTQQEIDSLEAHIKIQEFEDVGEVLPISENTSILEGDWREVIAQHFSRFHSDVSRLKAELELARSDVSMFSGHQHTLVHESFLVLVEKCRDLLSNAKKDNSLLSENLQLAELSVSKVVEDFDILKQENLKLQSHRNEVLGEVNRLKGDVSALRDRERMLTTQLTQNKAIAQEKEEQLSELKTEKMDVEERYHTSAKNWKKVMDKVQRDFEDKESELMQRSELLSEERDGLLEVKEDLEERLARVSLDNKKLAIIRDNLESQLKQMEERMHAITHEVDANESTIEVARVEIARLLTQEVCLSARIIVTQEMLEAKLAELREESDRSVAESSSEKLSLQESVESLESEKMGLLGKLEEVSKKEMHIEMLESKIATLKRKQDDMQSEMESLTKKHSSVVHEFQALEETQHSRRLENEKLKMTLTTEIKLLQSKLSSVESDKQKLGVTLSGMSKKELGGGGGGGAKQGAFHVVSGAKTLETGKKHGIGLQQQQQQGDFKQLQRVGASKISELQNRFAVLEKENKMLKEIAKKSAPPLSSSLGSSSSSSYDEEMVTNLRKKITEMTRKTFFLESDKQHLTEKVKSLSVNLKAARDSKSRLSNEHAQSLHAENASLHDRVRKLEESLTKKLMAADSKIVETVTENDVLKEKLLRIQSALTSTEAPKDDSLQQAIEMLQAEAEVLQTLKASLAASCGDLEKLESTHHRIEGLQQDIQLSFSAGESDGPSSISPSSSGGRSSVPSVFKSLPAGYLSNFQHRKGSGSSTKSDSRSSSFSSNSNPEVQKKISEIGTAAADFGEILKKHKSEVAGKETEVVSVYENLNSLCEKFRSESGRTKSILSAVANLQGVELEGGRRLAGEMKRQIESLQDQVMVRDSALSDIEMQMKADFEAHHKKFTLVKSQVLELREQMSGMEDQLRSKDQYIHQTEERCVAVENELFKVRKELDGNLQGQKEFVRQAVTDKMKVQGVSSVTDVIRMHREEVSQLQKALRDFTCDLTQAQSQLEATQREKSVLLSKSLELEKMHVQMKEHMGADIHYLRQLNLQLVERQVKADKATDILKEVKSARNAFNKQKDLMKMESELDAAKIKILEETHRIEELESQLNSQSLAIKILHAEKEHSIALQHHSPPELTNQISRMHMRPRSAESARKPKYKINAVSDFKSRVGTSGRGLNSEFSIVLPSQNARHGNMDILNLEEQPEPGASPLMLSLGPMVVTDDEYAAGHEVAKTSEKASAKPQRYQRVKKDRHRRTASTGSSTFPSSKDKDGSSGSKVTTTAGSSKGVKMGAGGSKTLPSRQLQTPLQLSIGVGGANLGGGEGADEEDRDGTIKRPGSAGSTSRQIFHMRQESLHIQGGTSKMPPEGFHDYSPTPVDERMAEESKRGTLTSENRTSAKMTDESSGRGLSKGGASGPSAGGGGSGDGKGKGRGRNQPANKSTDSSETTSSEGNGFSSKSSSQSDSSAGGVQHIPPPRKTLKRASEHPNLREVSNQNIDLSRTESMSSTCSTLSIYGNLPSRNESFTYDGGEESSTYEGLEIGDSVENLQSLGKLGYSPYITAIAPSESYTTSSSEDESYRKSYRKKSSTNTGDNTPRHRDLTYPGSNSSGESDTLGGDNYRDKSSDKPHLADIPAHVNESISISDMDREATDIEIEDKAAKLQQCFQDSNLKQCIGRKRYSSTGSVKICYSESSMEDISKN